jgi:hypothetical protein
MHARYNFKKYMLVLFNIQFMGLKKSKKQFWDINNDYHKIKKLVMIHNYDSQKTKNK